MASESPKCAGLFPNRGPSTDQRNLAQSLNLALANQFSLFDEAQPHIDVSHVPTGHGRRSLGLSLTRVPLAILIDSISTPPAALRATTLATLGMRGGWDGRLEAERVKGTRGDEFADPLSRSLCPDVAVFTRQGGSISARAIRGARLPQPLTLGRDDKQQQARYVIRLRSDVRARAAPSPSIIKYGYEGIMYSTMQTSTGQECWREGGS
ncbi:hypothetical protein B0H16DRAFT_1474875 [Mycena metata]|uniref:Uncharacterized protein n=1 Tax=Mycena metata TaxID=1033252 RepID=A0AAD7HGA9_9AGAR|nr:hypothetical protein B0H16DRAFT_1474875 [Mycena metata]